MRLISYILVVVVALLALIFGAPASAISAGNPVSSHINWRSTISDERAGIETAKLLDDDNALDEFINHRLTQLDERFDPKREDPELTSMLAQLYPDGM